MLSSNRYRPFTLTINREATRLVLSQRIPSGNNHPSTSKRIMTIEGDKVVLLLPAVAEVLHQAGFHSSRLEEQLRSVFRLAEADAARLTLLLKVLSPLQNVSRLRLARAAILDMSDEEVYYWYAKVASKDNDNRTNSALRALRVLLGGE